MNTITTDMSGHYKVRYVRTGEPITLEQNTDVIVVISPRLAREMEQRRMDLRAYRVDQPLLTIPPKPAKRPANRAPRGPIKGQ